MSTTRAVSAFVCVILLASCGAKNADDTAIHFALNEAKNTVTGMTFSKIEIATSVEECEKLRNTTAQGIEQAEYLEMINSVCVAELPTRLNEPFSGKPRYLELVLKYTRGGISTTEVFYNVDESWPDKETCEKVGGFYKQAVSHLACYSHQTSNNPFDRYGYSDSVVPTIESITLENEQRMLSRGTRR